MSNFISFYSFCSQLKLIFTFCSFSVWNLPPSRLTISNSEFVYSVENRFSDNIHIINCHFTKLIQFLCFFPYIYLCCWCMRLIWMLKMAILLALPHNQVWCTSYSNGYCSIRTTTGWIQQSLGLFICCWATGRAAVWRGKIFQSIQQWLWRRTVQRYLLFANKGIQIDFISSLQFNCVEENQKRLENGYGQVAFNYDQTSTSQNDMNEESAKAENLNRDDCPDEPYVPHPRFYIPPGVELVRLL